MIAVTATHRSRTHDRFATDVGCRMFGKARLTVQRDRVSMTYPRLRRALAAIVLVLAAGCATAPPGPPSPRSTALATPEATSLGRTLDADARRHPRQSGMRLLAMGSDALAARIALADAAERTLDLQYYRVQDDLAAKSILAHVAAAAQRGVRVRLLIDDLDVSGRDAFLSAFATHPNVEIRAFNPFVIRGPLGLGHVLELVSSADRLNRRMHNKMFVADNAVAIVGGRNLGNEYFVAGADDPFVDLDLLVAGPVVRELSESFDEFWNSRWSLPIVSLDWRQPGSAAELLQQLGQADEQLHGSDYGLRLQASAFRRSGSSGWLDLERGRVTAIFDRPSKLITPLDDPDTHIGPRIRELLGSAREEILVISPYVVPGAEGVRLLTCRARAGLRVRILTNSLASTDVPAVHGGYARYREPLLAGGVELFEMRPGGNDPETHARRPLVPERAATRLHAKAIVIDRRWIFVGSMNLDPRSNHLNTEIGLLVDDRRLAASGVDLFARMIASDASYSVVLAEGALNWIGREGDRTVRYSSEPDTTLGQRMAAGLLSLFVTEDLL